MAKAAVFSRSIKLFIDRNLSPHAQSARLATVAKAEVARLIASGRASPQFRRWVDGIEGAPEEAVRPANDGRIVYQFNTLGAVCVFALSFLRSRSPVLSGKYRDSFYLGISTSGSMVPPVAPRTRGTGGRFAPSAAPQMAAMQGGKFVPMASFNPNSLTPDVTEIVIGNTLPYSRKVDVQLVGGSRLQFSVPPGLFDDAVAAIKGRFGSVVSAKRVYTMQFPGQYILQNEQYHKSGRYIGRSRGRAGKRVESPALIITPLR